MAPTFKIGDIVMFELGSSQRPRWDHHTDGGGTGIWSTGVVADIYKDSHKMSIKSNITGRHWLWPMDDHPESSPEQWNRPGYLRHMYNHNMYLHHNAEIITHGTNV